MKVILAPDSFKGSLSADEVCKAMAEGIRRVLPEVEIVAVPMADGGEGTVESLVAATNGQIVRCTVTGPLGIPVNAFWGKLGDNKTAVIEMAAASGLLLVPQLQRDPRFTTTYGTGELILAALNHGCERIIIGIGGSATNDGGAGMAQSIGYRLLDKNGCDLQRGGLALKSLDRIDTSSVDPRIANTKIMVACDVTNVLTGPEGAAAVYGPQKGATPAMIDELDQALNHFSMIVSRDLGMEILRLPGGGAAGGLGAGLAAFVNGQLCSGAKIVMDAVELPEKLIGADLVITGEGRIDGQTVNGKTPWGVSLEAKRLGLTVFVVAGSLGPGVEAVFDKIDGIMPIVDQPMSLEDALCNARMLVTGATERLIRIYLSGKRRINNK